MKGFFGNKLLAPKGVSLQNVLAASIQRKRPKCIVYI